VIKFNFSYFFLLMKVDYGLPQMSERLEKLEGEVKVAM
jgi:signal transduction histidine kinase